MTSKKSFLPITAISAALSSLVMVSLLGCHSSSDVGPGGSVSKDPTASTLQENQKFIQELPFKTDTADAQRVQKGLMARVPKGWAEPLKILKDDGSVVWDMGRYSYIKGDISKPETFPGTVNPSLWRNAILNAEYGLFEVVSADLGGEPRSIYQVRGYDIANMSFVETQNGFIVIDVLSYKEAAAAAVQVFYDYLPEGKKGKPIHTVVYTHSHADHYGGMLGVLESGRVSSSVTIVAPERFMEEAISENVVVGPAMMRRARSMYGILLWQIDIPQGRGQVSNGLGIANGTGTICDLVGDRNRIEPTLDIVQDTSVPFDGTAVEFILTPHTEAPSEMVMFFPEYRSICLAEICNQCQHNVLTPRGAQVRDSLAWADALDRMKREWVDTGLADSAWGPHHWPRWGAGEVGDYIGKQAALYRSLHDGTVALMNQGHDMVECAEHFEFPPELAREWFSRGYYGATVHNVKAVYQRYLGWFDNNPANLWRRPAADSAVRFAKHLPASGGSLLKAARAAYDEGDYRWAAEVLDYVRLAPSAWGASVHSEALELQADAFEQLAYQAESGIWRNYFLAGAWRNRSEAGLSSTKAPTEHTKAENKKTGDALPFATDTADLDRATRGLIARVPAGETEPLKILASDGSAVWDMGGYSYIKGDISKPDTFPDTVNPSLWRQAILCAEYGLFEVVSRNIGGENRSIYQVRGYDIANATFVETQNGFIMVDVLSYEESAAAAVKLFYDHLPAPKKSKPVHTVIYTHSHADHYGGIRGVLNSGRTAGTLLTVAPAGFMGEAVSENVTVGEAMRRRAVTMYGLGLRAFDIPQGRGQVCNGISPGSGAGRSELLAPTMTVGQDGPIPFDGSEVDFLLTPQTEAPSSMVMLFRDFGSICLADMAIHSQHNILTPRGALVRDILAWSDALGRIKQRWVDTGQADSAWACHLWPRWGAGDVGDYLAKQADLYRSIHDGTVALMNEGRDMLECAEGFALPAGLAGEWFNRGYYGTTVHNVKAVYQRYLGWFDNNPANLWKRPAADSAARYAKHLPGSGGSLVKAARAAYAEGDYRWAVEVLDHVRLAPGGWPASEHAEALALQADAFEQLAYQAESGIWRNYFLIGAWRNRNETLRSLFE